MNDDKGVCFDSGRTRHDALDHHCRDACEYGLGLRPFTKERVDGRSVLSGERSNDDLAAATWSPAAE